MGKIAVMNTSEDVVDAITSALSREGFETASVFTVDFKKGRKDFSVFIGAERPDVVIYDIAPPYEENWKYFQSAQTAGYLKDIPVIITTTNKAVLEQIMGNSPFDPIEVIGKPFDINLIIESVRNALAKRSASGPIRAS